MQNYQFNSTYLEDKKLLEMKIEWNIKLNFWDNCLIEGNICKKGHGQNSDENEKSETRNFGNGGNEAEQH